MKRYVISDLHLGHQGILKHRTKFNSLIDMEMFIVNNWNSIVNDEDKVYILGDVAFNKKSLSLLLLMKGKKILIKGNHDTLPLKEYAKYFKNIEGAKEYKGCILTHVPVHECQLNRFKLNIHGHMHEKKVMTRVFDFEHDYDEHDMDTFKPILWGIDDKRYISVCCEQVNYTPVLLDDLIGKNL